jgi:electron transfer flavoprotein alpha subunit
MAVIFFAEHSDGQLKKNALEAASYAAQYAAKAGQQVVGVVLGNVSNDEAGKLGNFGANKVLVVNDNKFGHFDSQAYAKAIAEIAGTESANVIVLAQTLSGKAIAPRLSVKLNAGLVSGAVALPESDFVVKKGAFSGKAFAYIKVNTAIKIVAFVPNSVGAKPTGGSAAVETRSVNVSDADFGVKVKEVVKQSGDVAPLPEAELVVSAGRGMKGPENWGIVEDLAKTLGATTACSRPVADVHWRPHHEHVGQTGVAIRPNLYIAIGISGAIQHLAGVNQSKCIVVINKDPEAPFFKAADYGIVGDLFEIVPKLNDALKQFKAS